MEHLYLDISLEKGLRVSLDIFKSILLYQYIWTLFSKVLELFKYLYLDIIFGKYLRVSKYSFGKVSKEYLDISLEKYLRIFVSMYLDTSLKYFNCSSNCIWILSSESSFAVFVSRYFFGKYLRVPVSRYFVQTVS